jgi:DNA topoisomerase-1
MLAKGEQGPRVVGIDPTTGLKVYVKNGRFGPYLQLGDPEQLDGEKPKMASLLAGMSEETIDLDTALQVLSLPRTLGHRANEADGKDEPIVAANGRFGPYVKWGKETRSIPAGESPLSITLERAFELLAQPKGRRAQARARPSVLKELGAHPSNGRPVRVLDGRYGPYVSDGETHASLPKGTAPGEVTMGQAVDLLEARAARGGRKPGRRVARRRKQTT